MYQTVYKTKSLSALWTICRKLGLSLYLNKKTARHHQGEAPCDHVIAVPGTRLEIGVNYENGNYSLQADFYRVEGKTLRRAVEKIISLLKEEKWKK